MGKIAQITPHLERVLCVGELYHMRKQILIHRTSSLENKAKNINYEDISSNPELLK